MKKSEWDRKIPTTIDEVLAILDRRIEVHEAWVASIERGDLGTKIAVAAGVGTIESHRRYAAQYRAAIHLISGGSSDG